ncbi:ketoacyl-synt-domain-containing protein [Byssothecium circinans]|uniref:Ketoacyl-synt-domain-containing protein n=1 Tax=Byssothecium circinans TaxID=147558 RepID=A0A6A5T7J3_9PLEO|nr:ketoacyl-synt-domain-containing protein [Byssothecium circinans]
MAEPIAIVGSACRFPGGASSVSRLWTLLREPKDILDDSSTEFRSQSSAFNNDDDRTNRSYLLQEDFRRFDAAFFKINKKEADAMDPQNRILLETVFEAIESAGLPLTKGKGSLTSVHVGVMTADHSDIQMRDPETLKTYAATGLARSMLANRISYFFDFKGPSETIDTACSSSLVALHHAVQCIETGDAHQAVVAGSALFLDSAMYIAESKLHMLSPDSRSRMWDKDANGYSRGEGCAAILIKPLSRAIEDGDDIECVIRATAVNSDGRTTGITMPSAKAQVDLIHRTYKKAGLDPVRDRCQFFECHGTGHLEGCAGLAGILKASLAIRNKAIPPNLHFHALNPNIKPYYDNLSVPTSLLPWPEVGSGPLRASVNSFGFGGTNAHAILESYDRSYAQKNAIEENTGKAVQPNGTLGPFVFSAESESSLLRYLKRMSIYLRCNPSVDLDALESTLFARRSILSTRTYVVALDRPTLMYKLDEQVRAAEVDEAKRCVIRVSHTDSASPPKILGIFTGQGAQWANMGRELIQTCPAFRNSLETCGKALMSLTHGPSWSLMDALLNGDSLPEVLPAKIAQPLCTAIQIALVDLLRLVGIELSAVVGHSSGEIAAAYAAGILNTGDAMSIAYYRGAVAHLATSPNGQKGAMMVVGMALDQAAGLCSTTRFVGRLEVAASNAPSNTTLSGDIDAIYEAKELLDGQNVFTNVLRIDVSYHSRHMVPCAKRYASFLQQLDIQPHPASGHCIWYSSVREGVDLSNDRTEQFKSQYWVDNMVNPVLFHQALQASLEQCPDFAIALEVGPHPAMRVSVRDTLNMMHGTPLLYVGCLERGKNDVEAMAAALGFLWCCFGDANVNLNNWQKMTGRPTHSTPLKGLPSYAWDHEVIYWQVSRLAQRPASKQHPPHELLGRLHENLKDEVTWRNVFYQGDIPWLKGHVLHGQVVFPAAGYISMAAQAAHQLLANFFASIEFEDVRIRRPLLLPEGSDKVETLFKVKIRDRVSGTTDQSALEATFTCYSGTAGGDLSKSCEGQLLVRATGPSHVPSPPSYTYKDSLPPVNINRWFTALGELGIAYDGVFRALGSLNRIWGIAEASAAWEERELAGTYIIHPAILDVGLQIGFATVASLARRTTIAALPTEIGRLVLKATKYPDRPPGGDRIDIQARLIESTRTEHRVDIDIYDPCTKEARVQIDDLVIRALTEPQPSEDRLIFARTIWDVDVAHGFPTPPTTEITNHELEYIEAIERTSFFFLRSICRDFPKEVREGLQPRYQTMFRGIDMLLDPLREGQQIVLKLEWFKDNYEDIEELRTRFQDSVDLALLTAVGKNLPSVVRGESEMLEHMLRQDLLSRLYSEGRGFMECNRHVAFLMKKLTFKLPRAKILEIGAGTGGTTYSVLEAIDGAFASYTYTDVSSGFFEKAVERFSDYADRMEFQRFNIEATPSSQGFTESFYDIVIAANVLHATRQISQTVRHARSLLRPGGFLIGVEVTGNMLRETGLMAGLEGWWLGVDDGRFPLPGISVQKWDQLLSLNGFSGIDSVTYDCSVVSKHNCSVFVTRAVSEQLPRTSGPFSPGKQTLRPSVVIIGGQTPAVKHAVLQAKEFFQCQTPNVAVAAGFDSLDSSKLPRNTNVLCLTELDKPLFSLSIPHDASFKGLQGLLSAAANIVWVTSGGHHDNPYANMMNGIGRSLVFEVPNMRMQFLDFDVSARWDMKLAVQSLMKMIQQSSFSDYRPTAIWKYEPEMRVKNDEVLIPRLVPDRAANTLLNATRRRLTKWVTYNDAIEFSRGDPRESLFPGQTHRSSPGLTTMHVERSVSLHSGLESACFLCVGRSQGEDLISVALVDNEAPIINTDPDNILECPLSYHCDAEGLIAFGSALIASYVLDNSPADDAILVCWTVETREHAMRT